MVPFLAAFLLLSSAPEWRPWSPRPEIAPRISKDANAGTLQLEGGGNPGVFGGWEAVFPNLRPGQWYRFVARYRATGLTDESRQVVARLDWLSDAGKRTGQPDYAWRVTATPEGRLVTLDAPAPSSATAAKAQLLLVNAPQAKVEWSAIRFDAIDTPKPRPVRVAAVRYHPNGADPVSRFIELVNTQVTAPTDVILLPEGVTVVGTGKKYGDVAEPLPGPTTQKLGDLARRKNAWIVAGVYEREGTLIYNTAVLIDRSGRLAGKYRKVYLPREEYEGGITPGADYPVFETDFGRVGLMICWDVQYTDPARALALRGAELILLPIWGGSEPLAKARAIENHVFLASSGYDFPSLIYDPAGELLGRSEIDATVVSATLDFNRRYFDTWLGDMRGRLFKEVRGDVPVLPGLGR